MPITELNFNLQYQKFLWYFSNQKYIDVLNILHDKKAKMILCNNNLSNLLFLCMEALCLYLLDYKDSFYSSIDEILNIDDNEFSNLKNNQAEFVCMVLLIASFTYVMEYDKEDINKLSDFTTNKCKEIQNKYNLVQKSDLKRVLLFEEVFTTMIKIVNKGKMMEYKNSILEIINSYIQYLHTILFSYQYEG
jgi:hypothetical protein